MPSSDSGRGSWSCSTMRCRRCRAKITANRRRLVSRANSTVFSPWKSRHQREANTIRFRRMSEHFSRGEQIRRCRHSGLYAAQSQVTDSSNTVSSLQSTVSNLQLPPCLASPLPPSPPGLFEAACKQMFCPGEASGWGGSAHRAPLQSWPTAAHLQRGMCRGVQTICRYSPALAVFSFLVASVQGATVVPAAGMRRPHVLPSSFSAPQWRLVGPQPNTTRCSLVEDPSPTHLAARRVKMPGTWTPWSREADGWWSHAPRCSALGLGW